MTTEVPRRLERLLAISTLSTIATLIASIARSKVTAATLGPTGVGIASELQQTVSFVMIPLTIAAGPALTIALRASPAAAGRALATARGWTVVAGIVLTPVAVVTGLALFDVPHGGDWGWLVLTALFSVCTALITIEQALLIAFFKTWQAGALSLLQAVVQTGAVATATVLFGLAGQFWALALSAGVMVPVATLVASRTMSQAGSALIEAASPLTFDRAFLKQAAVLGVVTLTSGTTSAAMWSLFRYLVHEHGGAAENGLLQAARTLAVAYFGIVLQGMSSVVFPMFAAAKSTDELQTSLRRTLRLLLLLAPPIILAAIASRRVLLGLLYSDSFLGASSTIGFFMASDLAKAFVWALGGPLLYAGRPRAFVLAELSSTGLILVASVIGYSTLGLSGIGLGHLFGYLASIPTNMFFVRQELHIGPSVSEILVCVSLSLVLCGVALFVSAPVGEVACLLTSAVWFSMGLLWYRRTGNE
jgi:O-antigen/teichoic acid export membrane protein